MLPLTVKLDDCRCGHGSRRDNSGEKKMAPTGRKDRKEWFKCHKRIYLSNTIFYSWIEANIRIVTVPGATVIPRHICCRWNIVDTKSYFLLCFFVFFFILLTCPVPVFTYRCAHYSDETCFLDLIPDQIRDQR